MAGTEIATTTPAAHGAQLTMPSAVRLVLNDGYGGTAFGDWSAAKALAILTRDGLDGRVPELARRAEESLRNDAGKVKKHLTIVGASMAASREFGSAAAWLAQVQRLTADIATDILIAACDEWQKGNRFLPTVAELRTIAEPRMKRRRQAAARLEAMARHLESGRPVQAALPPPKRDVMSHRGEPMSEAETEELNNILERLGATSRYLPDGSRYRVEGAGDKPRRPEPRRNPTYDDYRALDVPQEVLDRMYAKTEPEPAVDQPENPVD